MHLALNYHQNQTSPSLKISSQSIHIYFGCHVHKQRNKQTQGKQNVHGGGFKSQQNRDLNHQDQKNTDTLQYF